jgi:sigma-E factor negative regulatory protein RseB
MSKRLFAATFPWRRLLVAAAFLSAASTHAVAQVQSSDPFVVRREVNAWLNRIHNAAQNEDYEGTFVFQRGGTIQSSRIVHVGLRRGDEYERLESLDGRPRTMLRHNDDVYTFIPERKVCVVDQRQSKITFPALVGADSSAVLDVYEPKLLGVERVAGYDSQVIELDPKDHFRFAYRLWADRSTGLLLRAQTLDPNGHVLEQIAFSQIEIGVESDHNSIASSIHNLAGWHVVHGSTEAVNMQAQGWSIKPGIAGFKQIRQLRRPMALHGPDSSPVEVDQAVFSDGLSAISVFVEPGNNEVRREGAGSSGATHILVKHMGDFWITLLGEVPLDTLQEFASAIKYQNPK